MFSDWELGSPAQPQIALLEEFEDGVKRHFVAGVEGRLEEFASGNGVLGADSTNKSQRRKKLILREENWEEEEEEEEETRRENNK